jgi:CheY-like chemotaxis protein
MCDIDILVVEDNPGDIWLLEEAFSHLRHDVLCITKGYEMLDILSQIRHREIVPPALVLLDLNLPEIDGFDILKKIKSTDGLRSIPVVIFSGSTNEEDIVRAYELGASAYLPKPTDVDEHLSTLEELSEFWLSSVDVPR